MNRAPVETRAQALNMLLEGVSMRATARITGLSLTTVKRMLEYFGKSCLMFHERKVLNVQVRHVQCDELWSFCYAKNKRVKYIKGKPHDAVGDLWTWTAIDEDSKMLLSYWVGGRNSSDAYRFMADLQKRVTGKFKISTDGHIPYAWAIKEQFSSEQVTHVMMEKEYEIREGGLRGAYKSTRPVLQMGHAEDFGEFSTSHVESHNLTIRMCNRRFARRTNAHSKKRENHLLQVSLYAVWYNWIRPHSTLTQRDGFPVTPAMAAGLAVRPYTLEELVVAIDKANLPGPRGSYGPRKTKSKPKTVEQIPAKSNEARNGSVLVRTIRPASTES